MRATGKGPATTSSRTPLVSGKSWNTTASSPSGASCTTALYSPPPATQPRRGHDSHQEQPRHQAVHTRQAGQMGHQELPAVRDQDGLHSRRRNLHRPSQGPPLAYPRISWQCCPPSHGGLTGHQQEPHAVHGPLLQLRHALPPSGRWRTNWESWPWAPPCQATSTTPRNSARG